MTRSASEINTMLIWRLYEVEKYVSHKLELLLYFNHSVFLYKICVLLCKKLIFTYKIIIDIILIFKPLSIEINVCLWL